MGDVSTTAPRLAPQINPYSFFSNKQQPGGGGAEIGQKNWMGGGGAQDNIFES